MAERARLRIRDATTGKVVVDYSNRLGTIIGFVETGQNNGSVTSPGFALGTPFYALLPIGNGYTPLGPRITFSGTTLTWTFRNNGYGSNFRLMYGYY